MNDIFDLPEIMPIGFPLLSEDSNSCFDMPNTGIEATDLSSLLSQFEEASQSLDGTSTPPDTEPVIETPAPPVVKSKLEQVKVQTKSPVVTPPATPPPEVLERIRAKRKRKLAIMLPDLLPAKLKGKSTPTKSDTSTPSETNNNQPISISLDIKDTKNVNQDYYNHIPDHDYCVNSPKMSPKREKSCDLLLAALTQPILNSNVCEAMIVADEVVIDAGDTSVLNSDFSADSAQTNVESANFTADTSPPELEEGEVPESPVSKADPSKNRSLKKDLPKEKPKAYRLKEKSRRQYRRRDESPVHVDGRYFDKIPAYFTTLSKPVKPPTKEKTAEQTSGFRREDFIERDTSPRRHDSSVFDKLPAYYSCYTNSTRYDNKKHAEEKYDLEDLDSYPCAKKPRKYRSVSRSRSRSFSRSRSRSYSRSRSRRRKRSYSSDSGSSSSSSSRSRSRSRSRSYHRSRSHSRSYSYSRSHRSYSRSRSRGRSHSRSRHSSRHSSWSRDSSGSSSRSRSRSRSLSAERRRQERKERKEKEKAKQIEERRIVYVGKIPDGYTRRELRKRFNRFGEIEEVSVHFREYGDNYGFVTYVYTCDAYAAIEKGNEIPGEKRFDLCFGGRRQFCDTSYADLDGNAEYEEELAPLPSSGPLDFDQLLKQAKQQQKKRR